MSKSKDKNELEYLRSQNRHFKKELKHLRKQVSRAEKNKRDVEELEDLLEDELAADRIEDEIYISKNKCPECRGKLEVIDLNVRELIVCVDCSFRKSKKK